MKDLTPRRAQQKGFEGRLNLGVTTWVWKTQWDARGTITSTLSQLADNLAELAAREKDTYVLLMVDNLPVPPPGGRSLSDEEMAAAHNLNGLAELTDHLHDNGRHVYLIAAGAESAAAGLMERVEGGMGIGSAARSKFDLRECAPLTPDELRPAVTDELDHSGVRYHPDAVEHLVKAANGSPARMRDLLDTALENSPAELTPDAAKLATASVKAESAIVYEKAWSSCSNAEMDLLTRAAAQGPQGLTTPAATAAGGSEKWQALERARTSLGHPRHPAGGGRAHHGRRPWPAGVGQHPRRSVDGTRRRRAPRQPSPQPVRQPGPRPGRTRHRSAPPDLPNHHPPRRRPQRHPLALRG